MALITSQIFTSFFTCPTSYPSPTFSARLCALPTKVWPRVPLPPGFWVGFTNGRSQQEFRTQRGQDIYLPVLSTSQCLSCSNNTASVVWHLCRLVSVSQLQLSPACFSSPCPFRPMSGNIFPLLLVSGSFSITSVPQSHLYSQKNSFEIPISVLFWGPMRDVQFSGWKWAHGSLLRSVSVLGVNVLNRLSQRWGWMEKSHLCRAISARWNVCDRFGGLSNSSQPQNRQHQCENMVEPCIPGPVPVFWPAFWARSQSCSPFTT